MTLGEGRHWNLVRLDGMPAVVRTVADWFAWSPLAEAVRVAATGRTA